MTEMKNQVMAATLVSPADDARRCFLCGGKNFQLLHSWEIGELRNSALIPVAVWRCDCGIVFLHPIPTPEQLPESGDWWTDKRAKVIRRPEFKRFRRKLGRLFIGTAGHRLIEDTHKAVTSGRLLDIGCGTAKLLCEASVYYECVGLEPSARAVAEAREKGFEIIEGTVEEADIASESFDVAMMDSVIEHVLDPLRVLQIVHRILRPRGVVVLKTPKFGGPAYRRHGKDWNGFRVGYHTYLFDGRTLGRTLEQAGFEVLASPRRDRMLDDALILWGRKPAR